MGSSMLQPRPALNTYRLHISPPARYIRVRREIGENMTILKAENLTKIYGDKGVSVKALQGVDIEIAEGEFIAIMGPSGSGKSTLLHLLGGLDEPSGGDIYLDHTKLTGLSDRQVTLARRRRIGFVFQTFNLLPTLTAEENIALPLIIDGKTPAEYGAKVSELLRLTNMEERRNHAPDELSGGQQQRVAVARALVTDPVLILADEPTGNLDRQNSRHILDLLHQASEHLERTIVMVTHDPWAASYAERVIFLQDGKIVKELALKGDRDSGPILASLKELEN